MSNVRASFKIRGILLHDRVKSAYKPSQYSIGAALISGFIKGLGIFQFPKTEGLSIAGERKALSGSPAKSGPLDFGTKTNFPLFFVSEKGLVHIYKKAIYYFPVS